MFDFLQIVCIFAPVFNKEIIGHKNSRQAKFAFSHKPNSRFAKELECKYTAFSPIILQKC
jgi:hypothetical protein